MNTQVQQRPERGRFQPRLEALESRWCPAMTVAVLDDHILEVLGDRGDNDIEFEIRGSQIDVTGDGSAMKIFTGIDTVRVNTWAGRDNVRLVVAQPPTDPDFSFVAGLGAGDDLFTLLVPPEAPDQPPPAPDFLPGLSVDVQGGAGNDTFVTFIGTSIDPESLPCPSCIDATLMFDYEGDNGNDQFFTEVSNVALDGPLSMNTYGGKGNDLLQTTFADVDVNGSLSLLNDVGNGDDQIGFGAAWRVGAGASTSVNLLGGQGSDQMGISAVNHIAAGGSSMYNLDGGDGDDSLAFSYVNAVVGGTFDLGMFGSNGNDSLIARLLPAVQAGGRVTARLDGGLGNDTLTASLLPAVQRGGSFMASLNGNVGDDTLIADVPPGPCAPSSLFDVSVNGGNGDDFIFVQVDLTGFTPESGRLHVSVEGGGGSDHLSFVVRGSERPMEDVLLTLDGGRGEDFAVASDLVHVMNCEQVEGM